MGNVAHDWGLRRGSIREGGGAGRRNVRWLNGEGERLDILIFYETSNVATSVFGVNDVLYFSLVVAADPKEDGQRDEGNTTDTSNDTANDGTNDGRRVGASSEADLIRLGSIGISNLNDHIERAQKGASEQILLVVGISPTLDVAYAGAVV